ncbi:TIGR03773 family transporter-associated surface protein [Actinoplanes teichomyceticus]|uniref:Putative ABC transporter-associated repeat protein n=1 Tax=Actinoplanes teichomyceticus TaxID=1867 RepID=A0A561WBJ0_ACTTI|nr:TIGR03773 family transporter-associated surface protein [Actinoplanes teichomyceticus]TWG21232.1 putative ABC transporter-associated repeat protein [Actinoplanes teichomyceticus]GIF17066.1 hypothetical protein Ate01nite_70980 [Actinoplanes teichomyceticus]
MTRHRRPGLRATVATAAASLIATLPAGAPASAGPRRPDVAGADLISLTVHAGRLRIGFRQSGRAAGTDPAGLRFTGDAEPAGRVPDDPDFAFLGPPGTPVWALAESGHGRPAIDTTAVPGGAVTLELVSVDGPGSFAAYTLSNWGRPSLLLDSDGRTSARLPAGRRTGGLAWLFDAVGEYRVTLRATVRAGSRTLRDEATYVVEVPGTAPPEPVPAAPSRTPVAGPSPARAAAARAPVATATDITAPATPGPAAAARAATGRAATERRVIADGHVDMGPHLSGSGLTIRLRDDSTTPATWRDLADVVLRVTDRAKIQVPAGPGYAFLGRAGDPVYLLPQSQQSGIVWPGWNTQHPSMVAGTRGDVTWRLRAVDGPGAFKLFLTGSFGTPQVVFDSARSLPQRLSIAPNTHAHGNWAFTRAGTYRLTVEMTATTTAGKTVSDTRTLTFAVGDGTGSGTTGTGSGTTGTGSGTTGTGGSTTGTGHGDAVGGAGALARTGADVMSVGAAGLLLLTTGAITVALTRRRRRELGHHST